MLLFSGPATFSGKLTITRFGKFCKLCQVLCIRLGVVIFAPGTTELVTADGFPGSYRIFLSQNGPLLNKRYNTVFKYIT